MVSMIKTNRLKKNRVPGIAAGFVPWSLFLFPACPAESENSAVQTVDDATIQDSVTVYEDDDETSVVTMYLTVSQGNEADNTPTIPGRMSTTTRFTL